MSLRVFIGYDSKESIAYHVLSHSIQSRASRPVLIAPVMLSQLAGVFSRERGSKESTEFSISRFLVPYLAGYEGGPCIYMDCDMLCLADIYDIFRDVDAQPDKALWVVKHNYTPKDAVKFLGNQQTFYPRKNWSSLMVFNTGNCRELTPEYVNSASGLDLHRFNWLEDGDERLIGSLSLDWNWLVGEYHPNPLAKILHYTRGGPWFPEYEKCNHADEWKEERLAMEATSR